MNNVYRILAFTIAGLCMVQVAAIGYQIFGILGYVGSGQTLDGALAESETYGGSGGAMVHHIGASLISLLVLVLLVFSFFARIPGGVKWALILLGAMVLQWAFAILAYSIPATGFLHAANALIVFSVAGMTGARVRRVTAAPVPVAA